MKSQGQIPFIQALRGIAAIAVVIYHTHSLVGVTPDNAISQWIFSSGPAGVDLFFMISGFVMALSMQNTSATLNSSFQFWKNRFFRIWPTYFIITILFCLTETIVRKNITPSLVADWELHAWTLTGIVRSMLFFPLNYAAGAPFFGGSVLHVGWSLNYEAYFYFILGCSLMFGRYRWTALFAWFFITLIAPLLFITPWYGIFDISAYHDYRPGYLNLATSPIVFDFITGLLIGFIYTSRFRVRNLQILYMLILVSVSATAWYFLSTMTKKFGFPYWSMPISVTFLLLALLNKEKEIATPAPLQWLGKISYSLYLIHPLVLAPAYLLTRGTSMGSYTRDFPYSMLVVSISIVAAWISYELLEIRLSSALKRSASHIGTILRTKNQDIARD
ncbi:exopolysaccharide production protein ExoZ [Oxalobacteraceae bacterium GrIS 1.11]